VIWRTGNLQRTVGFKNSARYSVTSSFIVQNVLLGTSLWKIQFLSKIFVRKPVIISCDIKICIRKSWFLWLLTVNFCQRLSPITVIFTSPLGLFSWLVRWAALMKPALSHCKFRPCRWSSHNQKSLRFCTLILFLITYYVYDLVYILSHTVETICWQSIAI
jgi:hypothetical protein